MDKHLLFFCVILTFHLNYSQVGIGTTNPQEGSILDIASSKKGVLFPRVNIEDLSTIAPIEITAPVGLFVYNTNSTTGLGFHYWDGSIWVPLLDGTLPENTNLYNTNGTLTGPRTIFQGANNLRFYSQGGSFRVSSTNKNHALFVNDIGLVGLNTNDPTNSLDINGRLRIRNLPTISNASKTLIADSNGNIGAIDTGAGNNVNIYNANGSLTAGRTITLGSHNLRFNSRGGSFRFSTVNQNNALSINGSNGGVGMGTSGVSNSRLSMTTAGSEKRYLSLWKTLGNGSWVFRGASNGNLIISEENIFGTLTNHFTFEASGNFGIGTNDPTAKLDINGKVRVREVPASTGTNLLVTDVNGNLGTSTNMNLDSSGNLDIVGDVTANGMLLTSDRRLKTDITPIKNVASIISMLNPVGYKKKKSINSEDSDYYKFEYGFIAQEVQEILPEIVHKIDKENKLAIEYNSLIPILIKAMQEQIEENKNLLKEIETIKSKLEDLSLKNKN